MKEIYKSYKFRLYPTKKQENELNKHIGCCRFVYNYFLNVKKERYLEARENLSFKQTSKLLTEIKKNKDYEWLKNVNSQSIQWALKNLDAAYLNFFRGQNKFPTFKSKKNGGSFKIPNQIVMGYFSIKKISNNLISLPKFKNGIKFKQHRKFEGDIISVTISKNKTNKWYISINTKILVDELSENTNVIGIDLGIKKFLVTSDNQFFENPNFLKNEIKKIKYEQKKLSKIKNRKSRKYINQRLNVASLYEKVTNKRTNFLHQLSKKLIIENQVICLENLSVKNMIKNHNLSQSIFDASWSKFTNFLEYKAEWYGRNIIYINRWFPSSKTCSQCGWINNELNLNDRNWSCPKCKSKHERDYNAAKNIRNIGYKYFLKEIETGCGVQSVYKQKQPEASSLGESMKVEIIL